MSRFGPYLAQHDRGELLDPFVLRANA